MHFLLWSNIWNTRKSVSPHIQTPRIVLKKRGAAEFFNSLRGVWICDETLLQVFHITSKTNAYFRYIYNRVQKCWYTPPFFPLIITTSDENRIPTKFYKTPFQCCSFTATECMMHVMPLMALNEFFFCVDKRAHIYSYDRSLRDNNNVKCIYWVLFIFREIWTKIIKVPFFLFWLLISYVNVNCCYPHAHRSKYLK